MRIALFFLLCTLLCCNPQNQTNDAGSKEYVVPTHCVDMSRILDNYDRKEEVYCKSATFTDKVPLVEGVEVSQAHHGALSCGLQPLEYEATLKFDECKKECKAVLIEDRRCIGVQVTCKEINASHCSRMVEKKYDFKTKKLPAYGNYYFLMKLRTKPPSNWYGVTYTMKEGECLDFDGFDKTFTCESGKVVERKYKPRYPVP